MRSYTTYDWMLASGLALKGLPLSLFAMTASYNRKGRRLYESRESLAGYLGYSERQVGKALQSLVSTELLVLRLTDGHREFRINIRFINEILEKKRSKNNHMADSFKAYLKSCDPFEEEEQSSSPEVKKVPQEREQSSPSGEKKVPEKEEPERSLLLGGSFCWKHFQRACQYILWNRYDSRLSLLSSVRTCCRFWRPCLYKCNSDRQRRRTSQQSDYIRSSIPEAQK